MFFLDYDLDGFLDIFAVNGGTDESQGMDARARLSQPPLMLRNRGNGTFENVDGQRSAPRFNRPIMGRGAAYADFDGDGDLDIAVATLAARRSSSGTTAATSTTGFASARSDPAPTAADSEPSCA